MSDRAGIEWTEATWNPTTGCDRTSVGCDNCYALTLAKRPKAMGNPRYQHDGVLYDAMPEPMTVAREHTVLKVVSQPALSVL